MTVRDNTTRGLVAKARAGDRKAFDELVARYERRLRETLEPRIGRQARGKTDLDDVLQETFLRAFESIVHFRWRDERGFVRWLLSIAENRIRDALKGPRGKEVLELRDRPSPESAAASRLLRRGERFDRLKGALSRLSADHQEVILLCRIEGLKVREAAERMGRSENAVKNLLLRALRELKSSFGDTESLHLPDRTLGSDARDEHQA